MDFNHLEIRTLTNTIYNLKGVMLMSGTSFIISRKPSKSVDPQIETCFIYLDNGKTSLEEFEQHVVNKKIIYENSI
jgi:hypothetical protein